MTQTPAFSIGIEEEYLLVDMETGALAVAPDGLMEACEAALPEQVSPEFLQCQIEIGTRPCATVAEARAELIHLRRGVAREAAKFGLGVIAASCHPSASWKDQHHTDKARYNELHRDLGGVVRRMLICGMHVHVGIEDPDTRIDVVNQLTYFLPHLLALSGSSPFWSGEDTKLDSYRLTVFDNLPRTGLPPQLGSWSEYERSVELLTGLGLIEDSSKIWWDLRPSARYPTVETRICDVQPRLEDTLALAAVIQCLARFFWRLKSKNQRWRTYDNFLVQENRWRAQRYGASGALIDFGRHELVPLCDLVEEIFELVAEDAQALGCEAELQHCRHICTEGNAATRQRRAYQAALDGGADRAEALRAVVDLLRAEFAEGLE